MFISPVSFEMLECYLAGLVNGYLLKDEESTRSLYRRAQQQIITSRGWQYESRSPCEEMRESGMAESEIVAERLRIEVLTWQLMEKSVWIPG